MQADKRVVILTGVGREGQVGETVAGAFAALGARIIAVDRDAREVEARAESLRRDGADAFAFACDLTDEVQAAEVGREIAKLCAGGANALVNMAGGFAMTGRVADSDPNAWRKQFDINLTTAYIATRCFLPLVREARGAIVFFVSAAVLPGGKIAEIAAYAAAKSGVLALMRAVADEERENGVRANAIAPTTIRTSANLDTMGSSVRYVEREQVADTVMYLCSDKASAVTGQVLQLA
ncbi:MAG: SDR family oxidoreductase [Anaerolineae bacterium]|nr:SDR family oxidoreductase [Gemmatimonadaceae bacterium]